MITPEDFQSWKDHPVTKKYLKYLRDLKDMHQEQLLNITNGSYDEPMMLLGNFGTYIVR